MNTLRSDRAVCRLRSAYGGMACLPSGGRLPYAVLGMPALVGVREPVRGRWLLFGPEIKMFAPKQLYSGGEQLLFVAETLLFTDKMLYSARKRLLSGYQLLSLCAVHRPSRRGIFHS